MTGRGPSGHAGIAAGAIAAAELATAAGEILLEIRSHGASGDALGAAGDAGSQDFIAAELVRRFPADGPLRRGHRHERTPDCLAHLDHRSSRWDPRILRAPAEDWAVHVALVENGTLVHGAVALSGVDSRSTPAARPSSPAPSAAPRFVVSRTRPAADVLRIAHGMGAELVPMGSAGAKAMAVVLGEAEVYAHSGGQYEWDSAAPVAVAQACGLHVSRMDGSRLVYNRPDPYLPDLLICRPEFADDVLAHYRKGLT